MINGELIWYCIANEVSNETTKGLYRTANRYRYNITAIG